MPLTPTTRASLLLRLCDSEDHEAWVEFVTLYEPIIYRLMRQNGLQDADARDVMQELLLTVSRSIDRWEPREGGSFRGWLRRVARNLVIHWLKQRGRQAVAAGDGDLQSLLGPAARRRRSGFDRVRPPVAPCLVSAGERAGAGRSAADDLGSLLGDGGPGQIGGRHGGETRDVGRGGPGCQVSRAGPSASGRGGMGEIG